MDNPSKTLINFLETRLSARGMKSEFCRQTGIGRSLLDTWIAGRSTPGIDQLSKIAAFLNVQSWELIKPENAVPTPAKHSPTVESLTEVIKEQEKKISELMEKINEPSLAALIVVWDRLDDSQRWSIVKEAQVRAKGIIFDEVLPTGSDQIKNKRKP